MTDTLQIIQEYRSGDMTVIAIVCFCIFLFLLYRFGKEDQ